MFGKLAKTVSGIAKTTLGSATKFRSVLNASPGLAGLAFPPQVSMGLKIASGVGDLFGVKIPNEKDIIGHAQGTLDHWLGGLGRNKSVMDTISSIERIAGTVANVSVVGGKIVKTSQVAKTAEEILMAVDWLL